MAESRRKLNYLGCILSGMVIGCVLATHFVPPGEPLGGATDRVAAVLFLLAAGVFAFARFKTKPASDDRQAHAP